LIQDADSITVRVKQSTPFSKVFQAYANRFSLDPQEVANTYQFKLPSHRTVRQEETPKMLELQDGATIKVLSPTDNQTNGGDTVSPNQNQNQNQTLGGDKIRIHFKLVRLNP
jgi:hypothetical protein